MLNKMVKAGVAINDVCNFVGKQSKMKKVNQKFNMGLNKLTMKLKRNDAFASAHRLRQEKRRLKNILVDKFKYSNSKCWKVVKSVSSHMKHHRSVRRVKALKEFELCERKMTTIINNENLQDIPAVLKKNYRRCQCVYWRTNSRAER